MTWAILLAALLSGDGEPRPLFNGRDLSGWETWLGPPHRLIEAAGLRRNEAGDYLEPYGAGRDPKGVFSVVEADGAPAIRISGEVWGALTTAEEFGDYHLRLEFKWGVRKWPPREALRRDGGLLYHADGPHGAGSGFWMRSFESQIQEGDCGDFHAIAGVKADVEAERKGALLIHRPGAPLVPGVSERVAKSADREAPTGDWNRMELWCVGTTAVHVVNGRTVLVLRNLRRGDEPATRGRIQLQSEGAELFFRAIEIRPATEIPAAVLEPRPR